MDIETLLKTLSDCDEMEATDGMNIAENLQNESKKKIYLNAVESIEKLRDTLEEGINPSTGKLDAETEDFFNRLGVIIDEILSRAEAFNESLDEKTE